MPSTELVTLIESKTGKKAVIMGSGEVKTLAAVAMLGGIIGCGSVQGVVRFVQNYDGVVIDGTVDGLTK